jgi:hypothetical protein
MKRRPILLNRIDQVSRSKGLIIALVGVEKGVGVTHTAITLANYLSKLGKKVALVELNPKLAFEKVEQAYEGIHFNKDSSTEFNIKKCTYFKYSPTNTMVKILAESFDYYILDIGYYETIHFNEFLRADVQIVIGMLSEWKKDEVFLFRKETEHYAGSNQWIYGFPIAIHQDIDFVKKFLPNPVFKIPFNGDPYIVKPETQKVFREIMV